MSGGIIIPGTAVVSDVRTGKTFSSKNGFNLTGTGIVYTPTVLQVLLAGGTINSSTQTVTVIATTSTNSLLQLVITNCYAASVSSITDTAGNTWIKRISSIHSGSTVFSQFVDEVWTTNGPTTAMIGGTITITIGSLYPPIATVVNFYEISNAPLYAPIDIFVKNEDTIASGNTSWATSLITPSAVNSLFFGMASMGGSGSAYATTTPSSVTFTSGAGTSTSLNVEQYSSTVWAKMMSSYLSVAGQTAQAYSGSYTPSGSMKATCWAIRSVA